MKRSKAGRNDPCPCGSGLKFKRCCEPKTTGARYSLFLMIAVGGALLAGLIATIASFTGSSSAPGRVWDPAHGHYHDASGMEIP